MTAHARFGRLVVVASRRYLIPIAPLSNLIFIFLSPVRFFLSYLHLHLPRPIFFIQSSVLFPSFTSHDIFRDDTRAPRCAGASSSYPHLFIFTSSFISALPSFLSYLPSFIYSSFPFARGFFPSRELPLLFFYFCFPRSALWRASPPPPLLPSPSLLSLLPYFRSLSYFPLLPPFPRARRCAR
ncbi:hypothetical protein FB451DRAFT_1234793 [Mycena latifolia]|nr:hypothetical protein FB451DRAFT_1234793 [Mycena latifolia]